jgi:ATP-dependent exoDNAse (exonuclease V) beta subunit
VTTGGLGQPLRTSNVDGIPNDFAPLADGGRRRGSIAGVVAGAREPDVPAAAGRDSDRLVGTLVHRLLQRLGFGAAADAARGWAVRLMRAGETVDAATLDAAAAAYGALSRSEDVRLLYASGEAIHEVPFTMAIDGAWLRGTIDCLVRDAAGDLTVLEFKTGGPRPEHREQVELYRRAAQRMFPAAAVHARLVYAQGAGV